ncbi:MAG TPA: hypothetical protein VEW11_05990, partial [Gaiellaceae bacterium]|nr:hypothetical protein [Gaiellaceae bacterium]
MPTPVPLPSVERGRVVVPAPGRGPGNWAGAPHAILADGVYWLSYRVRRAIGPQRAQMRGVETVVARSADGERFTTVARIDRAEFGTDSFERPCLVRRPQGGWRLYVCCATPGSKHWWIEAIDADDPSGFSPAAASPHSDGALRYAVAVSLPDGHTRYYFEAASQTGPTTSGRASAR